ncbi:MAG: conjugal transfer protein TraX [Clostridia bacterium]|nr:conjugal transfer protein TraX [Clostridia bacterium]
MCLGHAVSLLLQIPSFPLPLLRFIVTFIYSAPPIFFFFAAEGYRYTHNKRKYLLRVLICAVITQIVLSVPLYTTVFPKLNIIFSIFFALLSLVIWDREWPLPIRIMLIAVCTAITYFAEWELVVPLLVMVFYFLDKRPVLRFIFYEIIMFAYNYLFGGGGDQSAAMRFMLGVTTSILIITFFYNGKKGSNSKFSKYFFYVFYPAHWAIILIITKLIA